MHNVNRNRINAQEQARNRTGSWADESGPEESAADTQSIDLNHATREQLAQIEGIEDSQAKAIIEHRTFFGHFLSWEDVRRVPSMDEQCLAELQHAARIGSIGES